MTELREQLDAVDDEIVKLFEKRMDLCGQVGEYKIQNGRKVFDRQRESEKLKSVESKVSTEFNRKGVHELYEQLMSMSRKLQYQQLVQAGALGRLPFIGVSSLHAGNARIVFPGTDGAYSQAATKHYFGENCNCFYVQTFREAMEAIEEGSADFAVLPIENSTAGAVDEMYDQIRSYMESSAEYNKQKDTTTAVQNYLIDNCEAEVPEDYLTARVDDYRRQYIEQNCNGDESQLADYVSTYYGKTVEEMEAYWNEGMEKSIRLEFIMDAIADELGVEVNQDDIDTYAEQLVSQNGYESVEAMYNIYGFGDTDYGKRYFADLYRYDQALDQLLETAVVTIDPSADTESDAVTEDAADATEAGSATNASTTYEAAEGTEKTGAAN